MTEQAPPRLAAGPHFAGPPRALVLLAPLLVLALLAAVGSGLARMGVDVPLTVRMLTVNHGALMVGGVIGTVISLERAVALRRPWAYLAPGLSVAGAAALVLQEDRVGAALLVVAAAVALAIFGAFLRRQAAFPLQVMALGAACWLAGNLSWLLQGWAPAEVVPWWIAFLALTIAGERLELVRFRPLGLPARTAMGAAALLLVAGPLLASAGIDAGVRLTGAGALALGGWLAVQDTARRTLRRGGVATYAGVALVAAYAWLAVGGVLLLGWGFEPGLRYDAALHAFFLGFVFGAIFAHAPIILPAVTGLTVHFTPLFWAGLAVLHASVLARVGADLAEQTAWRQSAGIWNGVAILLLVVAVAAGIVAGRRPAR